MLSDALKYWPFAFVQAITSAAVLFCLMLPAAQADEVYRTGIESNKFLEEQRQQFENPYQGQLESQQYNQNDTGIIGVEFSVRRGRELIVKDVHPGTSAFYAGLQPLDKILTINGQSTKSLSMIDVDNAISNVPGDTVNFLVDHGGKLTMKTIVVMPLSNVMSASLRNRYGNTSFAAKLSKMKDLTDW